MEPNGALGETIPGDFDSTGAGGFPDAIGVEICAAGLDGSDGVAFTSCKVHSVYSNRLRSPDLSRFIGKPTVDIHAPSFENATTPI